MRVLPSSQLVSRPTILNNPPGRTLRSTGNTMRVMLVYTNRARTMEPAPPIGLSYVATATRRAGHDVRFVDLMMSRAPREDLQAALRDFQPEVVGFSIRNIDNIIAQNVTWHFAEVRELISSVREYSRARIVLGG